MVVIVPPRDRDQRKRTMGIMSEEEKVRFFKESSKQ